MQLSKIKIKNYRLLADTELDIDSKTTLIVGRNNTAKTSCIKLICNILENKTISFDDFPLTKRKEFYKNLELFMKNEISFDDLQNKLETISIDFIVDYSLDSSEENLGSLSPFIIDIDEETTSAQIRAEYHIINQKEKVCDYLAKNNAKDEVFSWDENEYETLSSIFHKIYELTIYAINPENPDDKQKKTLADLQGLFPHYLIPAERVLGEDEKNNNSLTALIDSFFSMEECDFPPNLSEQIITLRDTVEKANRETQRECNKVLSEIVSESIGFGYPNATELQLGVTAKLNIDDQIKNQTQLSYFSDKENGSLPNSYNGLGYKNLIKIQFLLVKFVKEVEDNGVACIPLLFIEEPESHMHPQMQTTFTKYLENFLKKISSEINVQTILTSHSAHIANTIDFSQIRYAKKNSNGVIFKDITSFTKENAQNVKFIQKYLTLTKCDLFFADKAIFVEGAAERLLIPDIIDNKLRNKKTASTVYTLNSQYYTLIEIGGAYAHIFISFIEFLEIPCLILTDLDPKDESSENETGIEKTIQTTTNRTIQWWFKKTKKYNANIKPEFPLDKIKNMTQEEKTLKKCHIEFQTEEHGLCAPSLEEAIRNVNRSFYRLGENITEKDLKFKERCKPDFTLKLIYEHPDYCIPEYIESGLIWLNDQKSFE